MANWVIRCAERYLSLVYDRLRTELCRHQVLQVDETTCQVTKDGRSSNTKAYIFVYRTSEHCHDKPVILYQYAMARSRSNVQRFLEGVSGILESDAFSAYKDKTAEERYTGRQEKVKTLVEAYHAWVREQEFATILREHTRNGLKYSLNHEEYLRVFLGTAGCPLTTLPQSERSGPSP